MYFNITLMQFWTVTVFLNRLNFATSSNIC
jgi:hypothetical protein